MTYFTKEVGHYFFTKELSNDVRYLLAGRLGFALRAGFPWGVEIA
jgi:hypothetical protein